MINKNDIKRKYAALCCAYVYTQLYKQGIMKSASFSSVEDVTDLSRKFCFYLKTNTHKLIVKEELEASISELEIRKGTLRLLFNNMGTSWNSRVLINAIASSALSEIGEQIGVETGRFVELDYNGTNNLTIAISWNFFELHPALFATETLEQYTGRIISSLITVPSGVIRFIKIRNKIGAILTPEGEIDITKNVDLSLFYYLCRTLRGRTCRYTMDPVKATQIVSIANRIIEMATREDNRIDLSKYSGSYVPILNVLYQAYNNGNVDTVINMNLTNLLDFSGLLDRIEEENVR